MVDVDKEVSIWVFGACVSWNCETRQFKAPEDMSFMLFMGRTYSVVLKYLKGQQTLDGTCSDLECDLALRAEKIFKGLM